MDPHCTDLPAPVYRRRFTLCRSLLAGADTAIYANPLMMSGGDYHNPGDAIVLRGVSQNKIWYALPVTVVLDSPGLIGLYWPAGIHGKWRMKPSGERVTPRDIIQTRMELINRTWDKTDVLMLITP